VTLVALLLAVAGLGLAPFFQKLALAAGMPALPVAAGAGCVAGVAALLLARREHRRPLAALLRWPLAGHLALIGVCATGAVTLLAAFAMVETSATTRSLFQSLYPAATVVFAWLLLDERLRARQYLLVAAMLGGIFLAQARGGQPSLGRGFWLLAATLPLVGFSDAWAKRLGGRVTPALLSAGRSLFGAAFLLACLPAAGASAITPGAPWHWVVAAGVAMAAGLFGLYRAMASLRASLVATFAALAPLVTAAAEMAVLDTRFDAWQWTGAVVVMAGAGLLAWSAVPEGKG